MTDLRQYIKHLPYQSTVGCCSASAALLSLEIMMSIENKYVHLSRLYTYYMTRRMQGRLGQVGAELKITFESLIVYGAAPDGLWPFTERRAEKEPNHIATEAAAECRIRSFESVVSSNINSKIDNMTPVAIGLMTGRRFWTLKGELHTQTYSPINMENNRPSNGHAVTIVGYDNALHGGSWIIANSLGPTWGDHGIGILPYECWRDIGEAYAIVR